MKTIPQLQMDQALERVRVLLGTAQEGKWCPRFERVARMPNAQAIFKEINTNVRLDNKDAVELLSDRLAAIIYALIFSGLGFVVEWEPFEKSREKGGKNPDLRITRDDHMAIVEVKRIRRKKDNQANVSLEPSRISLEEMREDDWLLEPYGDLDKESRKTYTHLSEIRGEHSQLRGEESILAIWDEDNTEDASSAYTQNYVLWENNQEIFTLPQGLRFMVCYFPNAIWQRIRAGQPLQELYCYPLQPSEPFHEDWQRELEGASIKELINKALSQ